MKILDNEINSIIHWWRGWTNTKIHWNHSLKAYNYLKLWPIDGSYLNGWIYQCTNQYLFMKYETKIFKFYLKFIGNWILIILRFVCYKFKI